MIDVNVKVHKADGYLSIEIAGHAGAGPKGADIVCAAVSAIAETAVLGLAEVARQYPQRVRMNLEPRSDEVEFSVAPPWMLLEDRPSGERVRTEARVDMQSIAGQFQPGDLAVLMEGDGDPYLVLVADVDQSGKVRVRFFKFLSFKRAPDRWVDPSSLRRVGRVELDQRLMGPDRTEDSDAE